jgi:hypothetical protein
MIKNRHTAGAPKGNRNAAKDRWFRAAILDELGATPEERHAKLRIIAKRFLVAALEGPMDGEGYKAIVELWDRLDGKAAQAHHIGDADGNTLPPFVWPLPQTILDQPKP